MALNAFDDALEEQGGAQSPLDEVTQGMAREQGGALRQTAMQAAQQSPDKKAEAIKTADRLRVPVELVEKNPELFKVRDTVEAHPWDRMLDESPELAKWLQAPHNATLAQDELDHLGGLEWLMTAPSRGIAQGINQVRFAQLKTESLFRPLTREEQDRLESYRYHMELGGELGANGAWWRKPIVGAAELAPNIAAGLAMGTKYAAAGAAATGLGGAAIGSVAPGIGTGAGALAGAGYGARAGFLYGGAKFGFQLEAGLAMDEYEKVRDEFGNPLDPDVIKAAAMATGAINAGLEAYGLEKLAASIPGVRQITGAGARQAIKEALKRPTVRAALGEAMKTYVSTLTAETVTEVAQRLVTILSGEVAKTASGQPVEHRQLFTAGKDGQPSIAEDLVSEGVGALTSFGLTVLPGPAMSVAIARRQALHASQNQAFFEAVGQGMAEAKTTARSSAAMEDLARRATEAGPVPNVYAPVDTWITYWQSKGQDPEKAAEEITGNPRAFEQGQTTGNIEIPTAKYAARIAPTEHNTFFASELRMSPDEMNTREAVAFQQQQEAAATAAQEQTEAEQQRAEVRGAMRERLEAAGVETKTADKYAALVESAFGQMASDAGVKPMTLLEQRGVSVNRTVDPQQNPAAPASPLGTSVSPTGEGTAGASGLPLDTAPAAAGATNASPADVVPGLADAVATAATLQPAEGGLVPLEQFPPEQQQAIKAAGLAQDSTTTDGTPYRGVSVEALRAAVPRSPVDAGGQTGETVGRGAGLADGGASPLGGPEGRPSIRRVEASLPADITDTKRKRGTLAERAETADEFEQRRAAHFDDVFAAVLDAAKVIDPDVPAALLREVFDSRVNLLESLEREWRDSAQNPRRLVEAIAERGGISPKKEGNGGNAGELRALRESRHATAGNFAGVRGVFRNDGLSLDDMLRSLQQEPEFQHLESIDDLLAAMGDVDRLGDVGSTAIELPGTEELKKVGIDQARDWFSESILDRLGDFSEFGQAMLGLFDQLDQPAATVDTLDTGEQQPRLPGAGEVRDQNVQTPEFEVPFSLTAPVDKGKRGKQSTLFQSAYHGSPHIFDEFSLQKIGTGEGAQAYGWGLYFASQKEVAQSYKRAGRNQEYESVTYNGVTYPYGTQRAHTLATVRRAGIEEARAQLQSNIDFNRDYAPDQAALALAELRFVDTIDNGDSITINGTGRLYKVEIPDDSDMLDWDKPLNDQPESVRAALRELGFDEDFDNITGEEAYRLLGERARVDAAMQAPESWTSFRQTINDRASDPRLASAELSAVGIPGLRYLDGFSRGAGEGSHNFVIWDEALVAITEYEQRRGERRGSITIGPDKSIAVNLFEHADLSTFLHESGHLFLEIMGDLAEPLLATEPETLAPGQRRLVDNYRAALKALGVESRSDIKTEHHEQWAEMFERYLETGKAPNLSLSEAFTSFRAWLLGIYRSLRDLRAPLTDEVRQVFDRMLASDEQIAAAEARGRLEALFTTPEAAGMSPERFENYRATVEDASRKAREELDAKLMREVRREQERAYQAQREEVRTEVEARVHAMPVYQALAAMRYGQNPDGSSLLEGMDVPPLKMSRQMIVDRYGADRLKRLPRPYVYAVAGGVDPELVAERFGFSSGDELLHAIEQAPKMEDAIERETSAAMLERYPSMLLDGTVAEAAQAAAASETREAVVRSELRALWDLSRTVAPFVRQAEQEGADRLAEEQRERDYERRWLEAETKLRIAITEGRKQEAIDRLEREIAELKRQRRGGAARIREGIPPANVLTQAAEARIDRMRVQDIRPDVFWSASRRAATQAIEAAAKGDFDAAITAKTNELLNLNLYRHAEAARADIAARVAYATDLGTPKAIARLTLAGESFADQIKGVLDRYAFKRFSAKELANRANMRDWLEAQEALGVPVEDLPEEVKQDLAREDYQNLTYETLVGVTDGLKQLVHLAQQQRRLLKSEADRLFSERRDALRDSILANNVVHQDPVEIDAKGRQRLSIADFYASHLKLSTIARIMDGQDGGQMWESFVRPANVAADTKTARLTDEFAAIRELLERHFPGRAQKDLKQATYIEAIGTSLSHEARLTVALNWGNEDGRQRLTSDRSRRWNRAQVEAILETLDANDLAFVNAAWKYVDTFWPEIAAKQKRLTGLEPPKVHAAPFTVRSADGQDVEMSGGYYPLIYDARLDPRAGRNEAVGEAKLAAAAAYVSATTRRGHTKARLRNVKSSVRLELGVLFEHVDRVVHDLTHHEMLIDTQRLLRDQGIIDAIRTTRGPKTLEQLTRVFEDIGYGSLDRRGNVGDRAANWMRSRAQIAGLGWNLWTALQQPLGLFNGAERVGAKWVIRGMRRWLRDAASMEHTTTWIAEVSPFMRTRVDTATQDIMDIRREFANPGGWFDDVVRGVSGDRLTQKHILDSFMWHIGIAQRVADVPTWLGAYEKAMSEGNEEARAIALADQAVIDSQGSGQIKDLAQIQRGGPVARLFMTFYSYGNTVINRAAVAIEGTDYKDPASVTRLLGHLTLLYIAPAFATKVLANLTGRDDDDDLWEFASAVAGESLSAAMNGVFLLRELGGMAEGLVGKDVGVRGYEGPAGARLFQTLARAGQQIEQGEVDEALVRSLTAAAGVLFGAPAAQVQRTIDGWTALSEHRTSNPMALFVGAPREKR